jgi:hypothetical protein
MIPEKLLDDPSDWDSDGYREDESDDCSGEPVQWPEPEE